MSPTGLKLKMRKLSIGIIKGIFFLAVIYFGSFSMRGEDNSATKEKIMEIKLNEDFIFGEGTSSDKEIAYGIAMDDLLIFANELKDRNSQEKLSVSDLLTKVETLVYENGSRYEVIVYIPLKIVIETERKEPSARSGIMIPKPGFEVSEDDTEAEEIVLEVIVPEIEEEKISIADNQTVEEPTVPQETVSTLAITAEKTAEEPLIEDNVQPLSVVEEKPLEEEMKEEPIRAETQTLIAAATTNSEVKQPKISSEEVGEVEDFLVTQDNFSEIKSFLSEMKRKGKIIETGAMDTLTGLPSDASLILIDELGGILAVLSPANSQGRINYRTHKSDSENNYNSKFIVWYKK